METNQDYANATATLVVKKNKDYFTVRGSMDLRKDMPIRFLDLLNTPGLAGINTGVYSQNKIVLKQGLRKHKIETPSIVFTYEKKEKRGSDDYRKRVPRVYKIEDISLSTNDNKYKVSGTVIGLKQKIQKKKKFIALTAVKLEDLVTGEISEHTFIAINPEHFKISAKYK